MAMVPSVARAKSTGEREKTHPIEGQHRNTSTMLIGIDALRSHCFRYPPRRGSELVVKHLYFANGAGSYLEHRFCFRFLCLPGTSTSDSQTVATETAT